MGKHIFTTLSSGFLMTGAATAFTEQVQMSEQDVVQAELKAQTEVQQIPDATPPARTQGPRVLTDEELDQINPAGLFDFGKFSVKAALMFGCSLTCDTLHGLKNRIHPPQSPS